MLPQSLYLLKHGISRSQKKICSDALRINIQDDLTVEHNLYIFGHCQIKIDIKFLEMIKIPNICHCFCIRIRLI